jgi:hypothetical protein
MEQVCVTINGCGFYDEVSKTVHEYVEGICSKPMQFTGLYDKNAVEIYEGDIVEVFGEASKVYYSESNAAFRYQHIKGSHEPEPLGNYSSPAFEVIGDIYENPELLEAE